VRYKKRIDFFFNLFEEILGWVGSGRRIIVKLRSEASAVGNLTILSSRLNMTLCISHHVI